ncbi:hypothetical protein LJ739_12065 [Aestuariibacter halophilus]|uniref:Orphan protein n=1 Tax=Fluctibacter halophilus TaxID=226011 RepID=A0ABS8G8Y8_9ALTE|nr:DUF6702 family protein [Aestuariibacter halophilus]MCC2616978.1 hypothetical protein [Aestuariibacter halophilus]
MKHWLRVFIVASCALLLSAGAHAHQQKAAITKVLFNPRTDNIEVMHRFYLHDAEHAVKEIFGKQADVLGSAETRQQFADYVAERFFIVTDNGEPLPLSRVGVELDGKFLWVYQETEQLQGLSSLKIRHNALRDIWHSQINTVNIERNGGVKTLTFSDNIELLTVDVSDHGHAH